MIELHSSGVVAIQCSFEVRYLCDNKEFSDGNASPSEQSIGANTDENEVAIGSGMP